MSEKGTAFESAPRALAATFGASKAQTGWSPALPLAWPQLCELLTTHEVGSKDGKCIVPASFKGSRRHKNDAARIDLVMLDSDSGAPLAEIVTALEACAWAGLVSSTHSHLGNTTRVGRGAYEMWLRKAELSQDDPSGPRRYLTEFKKMRTEVAAGASIKTKDDTEVCFSHQPCPRFRVALPLARPWIAEAFSNQSEANVAWKERVEALAASLDLDHDQSCTDTSRLFYLPRRPAEGPLPETRVLSGEWCDIFSLPAVLPREVEPRPSRRRRRNSALEKHTAREDCVSTFSGGDTLTFTDPATGETIDLRRWAARSATGFAVVAALRARSPHVFVGKVANDSLHHICCPNEAAHTVPGADRATFVCDAADSNNGSFVIHCLHDHCAGRDRLLMLRQMLEMRWLHIDDLNTAAFNAGRAYNRPTIRSVAGDLPAIVDRAEEALLAADLELYQRGPCIVRPGIVKVMTRRQNEVEARRLFEVGEQAMVEVMTSAAHWERFDARAEEWVTIDAPLKVARTYQQRCGHWKLPVITGLINSPTLRADGSVLARSGYDTQTGLLLETGGLVFPPIPSSLDHTSAVAAANIILSLIDKFPFATSADKSVALSAILTSCVRQSLRTAPLHAFTAPVMGSGKSKLVDIACLIATGREAAVMSQGKTEEEFEKRIGALMLAGETMIPIDNCEAPLGGEYLCAVLTQTVARTRILGRSEAPELPTNTMITATGNNLRLTGDMTRRAVICRLDPQCERPELREFDRDPIAEIKADRPRYLIAALTVLRAFWQAGRPPQRPPLGSFEDWSRTIRDAVIWLGMDDPVDTMEALRSNDPMLDALSAVMANWADLLPAEKVSVREVIEKATDQMNGTGGSVPYPKMVFRHPDFREALLAVAGDGGAINGRRLGRWLSGQESRIVDGRRFARATMARGETRWVLEVLPVEAKGQ